MRDRDTQRVYRLYDFSKAQLIRPGVAYCVPGKEWQACHSLPNGKDRIMRRKASIPARGSVFGPDSAYDNCGDV
jgi:hypothetical protein